MARNDHNALALTDKKVTKEFFDRALARFPALANSRSYRRLWMLNFFKLIADEKRGERPVITYTTVAWCEGKDPHDKGYRSQDFLERYSQDVYDLGSLDWNFKTGQARNFNPVPDEDEFNQLLGIDTDEYVNFVSGRRWDRVSQREAQQVHDRARKYIDDNYPDHPLHAAISYLHDLPTRIFKPDEEGVREARRQLTPADTDKRHRNLRYVNDLALDHRTPLYRPSIAGRTARVFSSSPLFWMSFEIRRLVHPNWVELDLKSSQLSINARLWGAPGALAYLQAGRSFWPDMLAHLGWPPDKKEALKDATYAFLYGMTRKGLVSKPLLPGSLIDRFFSHPVIAELELVRDRQMQKIRDEQGATDYFGKRITWDGTDDCVRSILAEVAQSYELGLILPVFEHAKGNKDFVITLLQHDGFSLKLTDSRRRDSVIQAINAVVNRQCQELGFPTWLEIRK